MALIAFRIGMVELYKKNSIQLHIIMSHSKVKCLLAWTNVCIHPAGWFCQGVLELFRRMTTIFFFIQSEVVYAAGHDFNCFSEFSETLFINIYKNLEKNGRQNEMKKKLYWFIT